jgi:hypothetical protein
MADALSSDIPTGFIVASMSARIVFVMAIFGRQIGVRRMILCFLARFGRSNFEFRICRLCHGVAA